LLGLEVAFERKDAAGKVVAACYKINDDQFLELYPGLTAEEERRRTHIAFLTADALRMSRYRMFFSSEKAKRELGYQARAYRKGLEDALAWFGAHGYLA